MASNAIKSPLTGDPLHPSEVLAKAALDERDEKSIIRVGLLIFGFGSAAFSRMYSPAACGGCFFFSLLFTMHQASSIM